MHVLLATEQDELKTEVDVSLLAYKCTFLGSAVN